MSPSYGTLCTTGLIIHTGWFTSPAGLELHCYPQSRVCPVHLLMVPLQSILKYTDYPDPLIGLTSWHQSNSFDSGGLYLFTSISPFSEK